MVSAGLPPLKSRIQEAQMVMNLYPLPINAPVALIRYTLPRWKVTWLGALTAAFAQNIENRIQHLSNIYFPWTTTRFSLWNYVVEQFHFGLVLGC